MIRKTILSTAAIALATPALSLSCLPPDVTSAYNMAAESEDHYIVVTGELTFKDAKLPKGYANDSPASTRVPARLTGKALTKSGFNIAFDRNITLDVLCFGPWCGGAGSGETYLTFLKREGDGYVMEADPCGSMAFQNPTDNMMEQVERCFAGGRCGK
ncbi:hypothetical protein [Roseovarius sp. 2305UL8-3]|uniref:hypothetical protein n=1 Tax=Roseovarius conchicola TaxID=3121636 RepID=UPI0035291CD1